MPEESEVMMMRPTCSVLALLLAFALAGCGSGLLDDDDIADDDTGDDDDATTDDDDATEPIDCDALPAGPLPFNELSGLFAAEDFAFDDSGHLISHNANALFRQEYPPGDVTAFATTAGGPGGPASLRMLDTGDIVYANVDTASLYLVTPQGGSSVIYGALGYPTGIDIHPSGAVFLADLAGVFRIDPYTSDIETIIEANVLSFPNGMTFSADYSRLYFGTNFGIYAVPVDADGTPTAEPMARVESPDGGELLGMGVDACDNLYAIHEGHALLRYASGGGPPETLMEVDPGRWMTNLQWGSGVGGWDADAVYVTDRRGQDPVYYEIPVGVGSKPY